MKTIFTFLFLALFVIGANAQYPNAGFEGDTATWEMFGNGENLPENLVVVANPAKDDVNGSDSCLMFTLEPEAVFWAGAWSDRGELEFTSENYMLYMMVYKDAISNCGLKIELTQQEFVELKVPNTVTDEWEVLGFDFSALIGLTYIRTVIFPDFPDSDRVGFEGSVTYFDNIGFEDLTGITGTEVGIKRVNGTFMSIYPNPATEVISIQYPGMKSISISNVVGQTVKTVESVSNYIERVPVSDLKAGVYFVTLDTDDGLVSSKFIKK